MRYLLLTMASVAVLLSIWSIVLNLKKMRKQYCVLDSKMKKRYIGKSSPLALMNNKVYEVISVEKGWYRVIDETGEDYLYPPELFEDIDKIINCIKREELKIDYSWSWLDDVEIIDEDPEELNKQIEELKIELSKK